MTAWHSCEPALTLIPNVLLTGIAAMVLALGVLVVAAGFAQRGHVGAAMVLLTLALFLTGGGIATLLFGLLGGLAATRIDAPLRWWRTRLPASLVRVLAGPRPWLLAAYMVWASVSWIVPAYSSDLMLGLTPIVTVITPLVILSVPLVGVAHDSRGEAASRRTAAQPA